MAIDFTYPWILMLAPLALLPFFRREQKARRYSSLTALPFDWISFAFFTGLKLISFAIILLLIISLTEPYLKEQSIERIGKGAQIILLLDRSASMNENFAGRYFGGRANESKVAVARNLLGKFVEERQDDFFGMISFSTAPIHVLPLTQDKQAILAAIRATKSRGRGVTNIAPGLAMALDYFSNQSITGSRVIMLVSDGAARIDLDTQSTLRQLFHQHKVMLYWVYLRNNKSASLKNKPKNANETTTPEYFLHQFFLNMGIPYQAFEAENSEALQQAIKEIGNLENKPIKYSNKIARQYLSKICYRWALYWILLLLAVRYLEMKSEKIFISSGA